VWTSSEISAGDMADLAFGAFKEIAESLRVIGVGLSVPGCSVWNESTRRRGATVRGKEVFVADGESKIGGGDVDSGISLSISVLTATSSCLSLSFPLLGSGTVALPTVLTRFKTFDPARRS